MYQLDLAFIRRTGTTYEAITLNKVRLGIGLSDTKSQVRAIKSYQVKLMFLPKEKKKKERQIDVAGDSDLCWFLRIGNMVRETPTSATKCMELQQERDIQVQRILLTI